MALTLRSYEPHDFAALFRLDQSCFPAGISYSKTTLRYFLTIPSADCVVDSLFKAAAEHSAGVETFDDQTVVAIKVKGVAVPNSSKRK